MCKVGDPKHAQKELKTAMSAVLVTAMLNSWQRPGAVTNATLEEYQRGGQEEDFKSFRWQTTRRECSVVQCSSSIHWTRSGSRCTASTYAHA